MYLSAVLVLTAAVTQASLQSMLHKLLTAGPSAFNLTSILSQAAQLSNQGRFLTFRYVLKFSFLMYFLMIWIYQSLKLYFLFSPQTAQQSNQSPMSLTSDASSPRSYVSPRISTPQTNAGPLKPLLSTQSVISQPKVRPCFNKSHF